MKVDVVGWFKDGAWCLPGTLKRLDEVLPSECVHRRIAVDDSSRDGTVEILKDFGWEVYHNPSSGISSGANYALSKVDCPVFMSFEQDLFLAKDWWDKIPPLMVDDNVAAASGVRFSTTPKAIRDLEMYTCKKYLVETKLTPSLAGRKIERLTYGKTLDNTLYRTEAIRGIGGFPRRRLGGGIDTILALVLNFYGLKWRVNPFCVSQHIRTGIRHELAHQRWYASCAVETHEIIVSQGLSPGNVVGSNLSFRQVAKKFLLSPFVGFLIACKLGDPSVALVHPLMKLMWLIGYLEGR